MDGTSANANKDVDDVVTVTVSLTVVTTFERCVVVADGRHKISIS